MGLVANTYELKLNKERFQASNYNCNPTIGGCRPAITIATRQLAVADQQSRLQPDNWRLQTCNRDCGASFPNCWVAMAHVFLNSPLSLRSFGLESPAISFLSKNS